MSPCQIHIIDHPALLSLRLLAVWLKLCRTCLTTQRIENDNGRSFLAARSLRDLRLVPNYVDKYYSDIYNNVSSIIGTADEPIIE